MVMIAAIDVGSSAIRMEIAELISDNQYKIVESLSKGVALGKDTFTKGSISEDSIQTACSALSDFSRMMKQYSVKKYKAIATSAVREASNSDTFIDRAFMRSGLEIDVIPGSEENRLTYMAIYENLRNQVDLNKKNTLVVEVGGGSTDCSFLQKGKTLHSGSFALGAVRLRQTLIAVKADYKQRLKLIDRQIQTTLDTIAHTIPFDKTDQLIALGGDIRFAAKVMLAGSKSKKAIAEEKLWILNSKELSKFVTELAKYQSDDELARKYNLSYSQAETLIPSLITYKKIIERSGVELLYVTNVSIRAGVLLDMIQREFGTSIESLEEQTLASAMALARKYHSNENHIEQVSKLSLKLFDSLKQEHGLSAKERLLLHVAALLHDVGTFVSDRSHHKHTQYIISASDVFGLSKEDIDLVANIARYHRKSPPGRAHPLYTSLDRESRMIVSKLAALLRIADALDQDYSNKVRKLKIIRDDERERYLLQVVSEGDLTLERFSLQNKSDLFRELFGKPVVLEEIRK